MFGLAAALSRKVVFGRMNMLVDEKCVVAMYPGEDCFQMRVDALCYSYSVVFIPIFFPVES